MRKLITLAAVLGLIGITWAATAAPVAPSSEATPNHARHGMGHGQGRMQGMMGGGHHAGHAQGHGKEMMACGMSHQESQHGSGNHDHRHATPQK